MIEILSTGALNTVQDLGRVGYLNAGVGRSGMMDAPALEIANALVGNAADAAGIEIAYFPFRIGFLADTVFAVAGADCPVTLNDHALPSWWAANAKAGDRLVLGLPRSGARAVLAVQGGIDVPLRLGSRATDLKSGFGGLDGRGLNRGDHLSLGSGAARPLKIAGGYGVDPLLLRDAAPHAARALTLRVLASAEYPMFTAAAKAGFAETDWTVTNDANRMGYRLSGPDLTLERSIELFSHGIMPGTVQVPPNGQPIIQLAEANTCGGYPKIATVIEADLGALAQAPVGARLRFRLVERAEAIAALRHQKTLIARIAAMAALMRG